MKNVVGKGKVILDVMVDIVINIKIQNKNCSLFLSLCRVPAFKRDLM